MSAVEIEIGDLVLTRKGYYPVKGISKNHLPTVTTKLLNGKSLTLTDTHAIITKAGDVMFKDLTSSDIVYYEGKSCRYIETENRKLSFIKARSIDAIQKAREDLIGSISGGREPENCLSTYTSLYMRMKWETFRRATISITKMGTHSIMLLIIFSVLQVQSMFQTTLKN